MEASNSLGTHSWYGSPVIPDGHEHVDLWFWTVHTASLLQGSSAAHGFMHFRFLQACVGGQTLSDVHPISTGTAMK